MKMDPRRILTISAYAIGLMMITIAIVGEVVTILAFIPHITGVSVPKTTEISLISKIW
jgi:hypothetical protein